MYIKKYWGNFIGGSDDSLTLVAFFEDQKKEESPLSEILPKSDWISRTGTSTRPWSIWNSLTPMVWRWTSTSPLMWSPRTRPWRISLRIRWNMTSVR